MFHLVVALLGVLSANGLLPAMRGYGAGLHMRGLKRLLEMRVGEDYVNETSNATNVTTSWDEVKDQVMEGRFAEFSRHPAVQRSYDEFRSLILEDWWSMEDYITCRVYDIPYVTVNGKRRAYRCWSTDPKRRILKQNDFPYLLPRGVKHKIYWCTDTDLLDRESIEEFVRFHHPLDDVICWANPFSMRSLPRVPHAHVLIRPNKHYKPVKQPFYWLYDDPKDVKSLPPILPDEAIMDDLLAKEQREEDDVVVSDDDDTSPPPQEEEEEIPDKVSPGTFTFYEHPYGDDASF